MNRAGRLDQTRGFDMRRGILCLAFLVCLSMLPSAVVAEEAQPNATLQLNQSSVGLVFGYTWGGGALAYAGKNYPVEVDGFTFLTLGFVRAEATGEVFNLKSVEDFNGTYFAATAEGTVGSGAGATIMKNQNGVVIHLFTTTEGVNFKLASEGVMLSIK
jgi:hypothetical protein